MYVKRIEFVLRVWGNDVGIEAGWVAGADGGVCGERPLVPEGVEGKNRGRESERW